MIGKYVSWLGALGIGAVLFSLAYTRAPHDAATPVDNDMFRNRVAAFARQIAEGAQAPACMDMDVPATNNDWQIEVSVYHLGAVVGYGASASGALCAALEQATRRAIQATLTTKDDSPGLDPAALADTRLAIDFTDRGYAIIEQDGTGHELVRGLVPVRVIDKPLVRRRIEQGKEYLFRVIEAAHPAGRGGAHKYYYASEDRFEPRVHTIYTASLVYTLLKLRTIDDDERILAHIEDSAAFLLSMQSRAPGDRSHGGFYYSLDLEAGTPQQKLVVGTAAKSIFTLLALHRVTGEAEGKEKYLAAARLAADWLLSMQNRDGSVKPFMVRRQGRWAYPKKESLLYTGQVLSALSRVYTATRDARYLDAADLTARRLMQKVAARGCYLGDDYRKPNPISSSWVILSLFDFMRATGSRQTGNIAFRCADELLRRQIDNPRDVYRHGRWRRSLSSSGNGWLSEVYSELYLHCRESGRDGCDRYRDAVLRSMRFVAQHTYTPASAFPARSPAAAMGGLFWNTRERYVRTDAVCHAMNAYIHMRDHLGDGPLITLPEPPLASLLERHSK